jgi:hypothetical protein
LSIQEMRERWLEWQATQTTVVDAKDIPLESEATSTVGG